MPESDSILATGYRYFLAVAETGSVRSASRNLNIAASAISRQLLLLEGQLGVDLFERHGRSLSLSEAGQVLLKSLKALQSGHEETLAALSGFKDLTRGRVRIATVESISVSILPDLIGDFAEAYPGLQVSITVAGSDAVVELVRDHDADLGFAFNPTTLEGLAIEFEQGFPLGATMSPDHPLASRSKVSLTDCLAYPVAWPARGLSLRTIIDQGVEHPARDARMAQPPTIFECNSLQLMIALARRGACVAFQTRIGLEQEIKAGDLVFRPLADRRLPPDRLMLVRRHHLAPKTAAGAFLDFAKTRLSKMTEGGNRR